MSGLARLVGVALVLAPIWAAGLIVLFGRAHQLLPANL